LRHWKLPCISSTYTWSLWWRENIHLQEYRNGWNKDNFSRRLFRRWLYSYR